MHSCAVNLVSPFFHVSLRLDGADDMGAYVDERGRVSAIWSMSVSSTSTRIVEKDVFCDFDLDLRWAGTAPGTMALAFLLLVTEEWEERHCLQMPVRVILD